MHKKAIVHILTKARMESTAFNAEIDAMEELSEKYGIKNVLFYKGDVIKFDALISKLEKFHILCKNYANKDDLKEQILEVGKDLEIIFVSTPLELLVNTVNEIKEILSRPISDNPDIFRDKYLQRELIQEHNPELGVKFIKGTIDDLEIEVIEEKVGYPFIIKPVDGVQSSGVAKVKNAKEFAHYVDTYKDFHDRLKSRGVDNKDLIVEEFIDGKLYSIDYYVTFEGEVRVSKPVKVRLGIDVKVDDYCNIARIATEKTEGEFKGKRLKTFINGTIKACGIRNTFVHHEFKINSKGELKTIELNGRIGGGRIELLKRAYDFNLYELLLNPDAKCGKIKSNDIDVNIYATKRGILKGFNKKLFKRIEARPSVFATKFEECAIGKEIGLTKDGFIKVGVIKLKNKKYSELAKDFNYIKSKYGELLDIEEFKKKGKKKKIALLKSNPKTDNKEKKGVFGRIKGLFSRNKK